jgi:hypothetical protein
MAAEAMMQEEIEVPEGGIAELVMDDQTAEEVYGADEEDVPSVLLNKWPLWAVKAITCLLTLKAVNLLFQESFWTKTKSLKVM